MATPKFFGMDFVKGLALLLQADKKKLEDAADEVRREEVKAERYVEEHGTEPQLEKYLKLPPP